jgi:hypothetical protein
MQKKKRHSTALVEASADDPAIASWHRLIGRAIVSFGTLEQLTLSWASALSRDPQMSLRLHKNDMKAFAPALEKELRKMEHKLPRPKYQRALKAVRAASALINDRNDIAHGWLQAYEGTALLFVAKPVRGGKMVIGVRKHAWAADVIARTDLATIELRAAMNDVGQQIGGLKAE